MKHHIIPKFLLGRWADKDPEGRLHVYIHREGRFTKRKLAPAATSYIPDLYAFTVQQVAGLHQQAVEIEFLQKLDAAAAKVLVKLESNDALSDQDRVTWTQFLMMMSARQPDVVDHMVTEGETALRDSLAERPEEFEALSNVTGQTFEEWTAQHLPGLLENFGKISLSGVAENADIGRQILALKWKVRTFGPDVPDLMLGDRPLYIGSTLEKSDFLMVLPISPRKVFLATPTEKAVKTLAREPARALAAKINEETIRKAHQRVYARSWAGERFIVSRLPKFGDAPPPLAKPR